jgi:hypothetical protein
LFPSNQRILQSADFGFMFFEKPQACSHNIAGRPIPSSLHLLTDETGKMSSKGYGRVPGHIDNPFSK